MNTIRRVTVEPPDPGWAHRFETEAGILRAVVGPNLRAVHHIGSTSVRGMWAKPIIDVLVEAGSLATLDAANAAMIENGYRPMGEYGLPGRRYFQKHSPAGERTHHVHAYLAGNPEIRRHLAFRDYLRVHPAAAAEYSALKQRLAATHPEDMASYIEGKASLVECIEKQALAWQEVPRT